MATTANLEALLRSLGKGVSSRRGRLVQDTTSLTGLDLSDSVLNIPTNSTPLAHNFRTFNYDETGDVTTLENREGSIVYSTPDATDTGVGNGIGGGDTHQVAREAWYATPFTAPDATPTNRLYSLDILTTSTIDTDNNLLSVSVHASEGNKPGRLIAQSSPTEFTSPNATCYFVNGLALDPAASYWLVCSVPDAISVKFEIKTQTGTTGLFNDDGDVAAEGRLWTAVEGFAYTNLQYLDVTNLRGRAYFPLAGDHQVIFATRDALIKIDLDTKEQSTIGYLTASDLPVRFAQVEDKLIIVDGLSRPRIYDGTDIETLDNAPEAATHVAVAYERVFFAVDGTELRWSEGLDQRDADGVVTKSYLLYPDNNNYHIPSPHSEDFVTGFVLFNNYLLLFTSITKYIIRGTNLFNFTLSGTEGSPGAASQDAIVSGHNYVFYMDKSATVRAWNGATDVILSRPIAPILNQISRTGGAFLAIDGVYLKIYFGTDKIAVLDLLRSGLLGARADERTFVWYLDSGRNVGNPLTLSLEDDQPLLEFSEIMPIAYQTETGHSDVGAPIDMLYSTPPLAFGENRSTSLKNMRRFRVFVEVANHPYSLYVGTEKDLSNQVQRSIVRVGGDIPIVGEGLTIGDFIIGGKPFRRYRVGSLSGKGYHLAYSFAHSSSYARVKIFGYSTQLTVGKPR